jgi:hypothetical protein
MAKCHRSQVGTTNPVDRALDIADAVRHDDALFDALLLIEETARAEGRDAFVLVPRLPDNKSKVK